MGLLVRCDRCNCELSGLDDAYLLRYDSMAAWSLTNLNRTALGLLDSGENIVLCENCMSDFDEFMKGVEDDARP